MAVSPARIEIPIGKRPVARALKVTNQGNEAISVAIRVANFDLDENNKIREIAPTAQSLDQWIIIRPLKFTVPAGKTRTIRFAVRPYVQPRPGEHRAMIFLEQTPSKNSKRKPNTLEVRFRFGVAVYGQAGPARRRTRLHAISADAAGFGLDVQNVGNAHARLRGRYGVWPVARFPGGVKARALLQASAKSKTGQIATPKGATLAGLLPSSPVLPGYRRRLGSKWPKPLAQGRYLIQFVGRLGDASFIKQKTFVVE